MTVSFVKSQSTATPVAASKATLERMLRRYGAQSFHVAHDFATRGSTVMFVIPNDTASPSSRVPVSLNVETQRVARMLFPRARGRFSGSQLEQAERVAWRNLILWVDAALSAAAIGLQTITEAFFAHTVVGPDGERMMDLVGAYQAQLGPGVQRLLTSNAEQVD